MDERFDRATLTLVRKLAFRHVEAQLSWLVDVAFGINEAGAWTRICKSLDQPSGHDLVYTDAPSREPCSASQFEGTKNLTGLGAAYAWMFLWRND
jgi:hypothetical protein